MHPFNNNEMFILALVAVSIVGVICIGLLAVLAMFVLRRKCHQPHTDDTSNINKNPMKPDQSQIDKIENEVKDIKKEVEKSRISRWTTGAVFGGSILILGISTLLRLIANPWNTYSTAILIIVVGLGFMILCWSNQRKEIRSFKDKWGENK
jgi:Flp pilus assembly protein TadB